MGVCCSCIMCVLVFGMYDRTGEAAFALFHFFLVYAESEVGLFGLKSDMCHLENLRGSSQRKNYPYNKIREAKLIISAFYLIVIGEISPSRRFAPAAFCFGRRALIFLGQSFEYR